MRRLMCLVLVVACHPAPTFDRDRFEPVVTGVRSRSLDPGRLYRFKLDAELDPASLVPFDDASLGRGDGRGLVRAMRTASGKLAVSIETRDDGHAGEHGFMYADPGMTDADLEGTRLDSQHEEKLGGGWVRWSYDLD
jgi:hypothetical protein